MHIVHVSVHVKPEYVEDFIRETLENARNSVEEPGIVRFDVIQETDTPTRFMLLEVYRDKDAPAKHKETEHYAKWRDAVTDMLAEPRTKIVYTNCFPDEQGW